MKKLVGKFFTTGGGIDAYVTSTNLRNDQRPLYLFSEKPQERVLHYSLRRPSVHERNVKSTERFSHMYFQNCLSEWNQLDETIKKVANNFCV